MMETISFFKKNFRRNFELKNWELELIEEMKNIFILVNLKKRIIRSKNIYVNVSSRCNKEKRIFCKITLLFLFSMGFKQELTFWRENSG